jgi:hypothetical protein
VATAEAAAVTKRALSVTQQALNVTQQALNVTQPSPRPTAASPRASATTPTWRGGGTHGHSSEVCDSAAGRFSLPQGDPESVSERGGFRARQCNGVG